MQRVLPALTGSHQENLIVSTEEVCLQTWCFMHVHSEEQGTCTPGLWALRHPAPLLPLPLVPPLHITRALSE